MSRRAPVTGARTQVSNRADADPARAPTYRGAGVVRTAGQDHCAPAHRSEDGPGFTDLDTRDPTEAGRIRSMWCTVLLIAMADAARDPAARAWFGTRDFTLVADWAGLDPDAAADIARRLSGNPAPCWRTDKEPTP